MGRGAQSRCLLWHLLHDVSGPPTFGVFRPSRDPRRLISNWIQCVSCLMFGLGSSYFWPLLVVPSHHLLVIPSHPRVLMPCLYVMHAREAKIQGQHSRLDPYIYICKNLFSCPSTRIQTVHRSTIWKFQISAPTTSSLSS